MMFRCVNGNVDRHVGGVEFARSKLAPGRLWGLLPVARDNNTGQGRTICNVYTRESVNVGKWMVRRCVMCGNV